jgi:hypothetical protein
MGTPIVDLNGLALKLARILLNPVYKVYYRQMLAQYNVDRGHQLDHSERLRTAIPSAVAPSANQNAVEFAKDAVKRAFGTVEAPKLLYPVTVEEIVSRASFSLYRAYYGAYASTLGSWWSEGGLLRDITSASPCRDASGNLKHAQVLEFMLSSGFVHPYWNQGTDVAKMTVPAGSRIPVIVGRGDWQAMKTAKPQEMRRLSKNAATAPKIPNTLKIGSVEDVIDKLGMLPIPGLKQVFVPLFKDTWVKKIPHLSPDWPFA